MSVKILKANPESGADSKQPPKSPVGGSPAVAPASPSHIKLIDIKKAAEFLNVSVSTVRRLKKRGAIAACPIGNRVMFNLFDLVAYVRQGQIAALL